MPFDTPPGQVLSSVPSPDRRRTSKLGGCASVLFQIFNGKRLFHRKSLPAERPKQSPNTHTEEQGPVKTLLTVADESLSISYRDTDEASETESACKVEDIQTFDENVPSRSVGVVARLMGLETMPPLGSSYCECKHFEQEPKVDDSTSGDAPQWDRRTSKEKAVRQSNSSLSRSITREFKTDLPAKFAARRREKIKDSRLKSKFAFNGSSVSPEHFNSAFPLSLSSAKDGSLIKSGSFHKSIVPTQKDTSVVEAPPKMLDSTLQVNCPAKIQLQSTVSRNIHGSGNPATKCSGQDVLLDPKKQQTTAAIQVPYNKRNESKPTIASTRLTMDNMLSRQKNPYFHKPLSTQHAAGKIKCPIDEATLVRRQQQSFDQPKVNIAENVKPCLRRQQEISSRLIQPTVCSALKIQRARSRHPSPPKSVQDSSGPACSSQGSNCVPSSYDCPLASHLSKSQVGSNVVSAGKLFSTSEKVSHRHIEDLNDFVHAALPLHHASRERADVHRKNVTTMHIADFSQSDDSENSLYSHFSQDGLISSVIYTESLQKSSLETSISSDPSLSKSISSSEDSLNNLTADERNVDWESEHGKYPDMQNAFNLFSCESSSESLSSSLSVSMDDTASSHSQVDTNGNNIKSGSLCPGKNAAAILQELITALSSSRSQGKSNDTESDQIAPYCTEVGRSHSLADCVQHKIILSTESTSEGAECSYSLESVQHSQGAKECGLGNPCTSNFPPETLHKSCQLHHEISKEHADFGDCEALMNTIMKLHHIDPETIGFSSRTEMHSDDKVTLNGTSRDGLSRCFADSSASGNTFDQALQHEWGFSNSTTLTAEDDADSIYRLDIESSFRNDHDEVASLSKRLVTDCLNEAFKSLSKQFFNFSSISEQSSASHVLSKVYKQLDEWRGMATTMNLDEMVEKEMNLTTRIWRNIGNATEEVVETVESAIYSVLLEELLLELF